MSTRIDITVITRSLRQFAKDVVANNRRAQLQKETDRRTESEAKRKREKKVEAEVPWPGAVPEGGIRPELAAYRDSEARLAWCWLLDLGATNPVLESWQEKEPGLPAANDVGPVYMAPTAHSLRVLSGDGSATLDLTVNVLEADAVRSAVPADYALDIWKVSGGAPAAGSGACAFRPRLLPTGKQGVAMLVIPYTYRFSTQLLGLTLAKSEEIFMRPDGLDLGSDYTEYFYAAYVNYGVRCVLVAPDSLREVQAPAELLTAFAATTTQPEVERIPHPTERLADTGMPTVPSFTAGPTYYEATGGRNPGWWDVDSVESVIGNLCTPREFLRLAGVADYADSSRSMTFIEPDTSTEPGWWADVYNSIGLPTAFDNGNPMRWRGRRYTVASLPFDESGSLPAGVMPPYDKAKQEMSGEVVSDSGYLFYGCHDWGDAALCRRKLLALGFTTADLTP